MLPGAVIEGTMIPEAGHHRSVMLQEVLDYLRPEAGSVLADATVGGGGHAESILERIGSRGKLLGIDTDPSALDHARRRLHRFGDRFVPIHGRHENLPDLLRSAGAFALDGIVADLGISSLQMDDPERGFSFSQDGPLDMRMDASVGTTAADLLASAGEEELREILWRYGEEKNAARIARAIVRGRSRRPLLRTGELADLVKRVIGPRGKRYRIHPATRTFMALRIAVNREIEGIEKFVIDAASMLRKGGRLVVISFHSLEDRAVKRTLRTLARRCVCPPSMPVCGCGKENIVKVLTGRPVRPSEEETGMNPRARSARLRAAERI
jgi:16S rRNA (cytosine1402-N4)-methyltransferase